MLPVLAGACSRGLCLFQRECMAISSEKRSAGPYRSDGSRVIYEFNFQVFKAEDIRVVVADLEGAESDVPAYSYEVALNEDQNQTPGGYITLLEAFPKDYVLAILSDVDYLQQTVLTNRGGFFPEVVNAALDKLTIQIQQVNEIVSRCLKVGAASTKTPEDVINDLNSQFDNGLALLNKVYAATERAELAARALESPQFGAYQLKKQVAQTSISIDPVSAGVFVYTLTRDRCWLELKPYTEVPNTARMLTLFFVQTVGCGQIEWPDNVRWSQGRAPILSSEADRIDCVSLLTLDGGQSWLGTFNGGWF